VIYAVLTGGVMVLPYAFTKVQSAGSLIVLSLMIAGCAIAALIVLAGVMRRAADAIETQPELPQARLR
jgi:hypothetical protein